MTFSDIQQAPGFLPWFEDLNNSPKEMTHYYTHMYSVPGKLLAVGEQEQEGDSHSSKAWQAQAIWGFTHARPKIQPTTSPQPVLQAGRGCPQVLGERQLGKDNLGLPEDLVATLSITLTITEPPNFLAQAAKAFSVLSGGSVFPKQHISIGRAGVFNYPHSEKGEENFIILLGNIHLIPAFNTCPCNLSQKETFSSSAGGTVACRPYLKSAGL